ncbi:family 20 glycosylhydrolase [Streptomyces sp. XD-27]|uniref:family 20 glycosylhydrolase n=1 Tax=Streptomyces sp. XD-27 TaxID=3062779 RepID=UPI0026F4395F|nr:family 20 glycosylhydrolase [Streptomyces sp. XD-27]WKX70826.1 family 20 glycosylhydrolase [Streptomyces sp. XD-27]
MRVPRMSRPTPIRAAAVVTVAAIVAPLMTLAGCGDGDGRSKPSPSRPRTTAPSSAPRSPSPSATPSPTSHPVPPPRTIPAVRTADTRSGPGWRPGGGSRVVADPEGPLADEARLLAGELRLSTGDGPPRRGDVELAVASGHTGGPEAYTLAVHDGRVRITGAADAGVFYGTRTLLQAVRSTGGLPDGEIRDRPERPQRGLHLDIARKYFTPAWIEARLREMADLKLNQLALHFSDDQGFRIQSDTHPEIVSERHLTKDQVRRIVRLAGALHITVIPELDSPGHLGAVLRAHPDLQLRRASGTPVTGSVDIANPAAARIVDDLLREFTPLFPGPYWHLGGDEYLALTARDPEASYPRLAAAARRDLGGRARVQDLATDWLNDRARLVRGLGKTPKAWNDGFFPGGVVAPDRAFQVEYWTGREIGARPPAQYLAEGWKMVNLNDEYLYYVLGEPNQFRYPTGERIYEEWSPEVLRGTRPVPGGLPTGPDRVLGGRLAVWCDRANAQTQEQVAAGIRLPLRAVAQRLWDPRKPALSWQDFTVLAGRVD